MCLEGAGDARVAGMEGVRRGGRGEDVRNDRTDWAWAGWPPWVTAGITLGEVLSRGEADPSGCHADSSQGAGWNRGTN